VNGSTTTDVALNTRIGNRSTRTTSALFAAALFSLLAACGGPTSQQDCPGCDDGSLQSERQRLPACDPNFGCDTDPGGGGGGGTSNGPACPSGFYCASINGGFETVANGVPSAWSTSCGWGTGTSISIYAANSGTYGLRVAGAGCAVETPVTFMSSSGLYGSVSTYYRTAQAGLDLWLGWYDAGGNLLVSVDNILTPTSTFGRASDNIPRPSGGVQLKARIINTSGGAVIADFDDVLLDTF
jgi:hypothetical protein